MRRLPILILLGGGIVLSLLTFALVRNLEQQRLRVEFTEAAEDRIIAVRTTLATYLELLDAIAAFYAATVQFDRQAFSTFVTPLLTRRPGISSLEWIPRVPQAQRAAYEAAARADAQTAQAAGQLAWAEVLHRFQFTERLRQGVMIPAEPREEYYPVYYQEPLVEGGIAVGFDLGSNPTRLAALSHARDTGQIVATARVILVEETQGERYSTLVFRPVYRQGASTATLQDRRTNLVGFALVVLRISAVVAEALAPLPPQGIGVTLYDTSAPAGAQLLYSYPGTPLLVPPSSAEQSLPPRTSLYHTAAFDIGGRQWVIVAEPTLAYLAAKRSWYPWLACAGALALTAVLTAYVQTTTARSMHIRRLVAERTAQLRQANVMLQQTTAVSEDVSRFLDSVVEHVPLMLFVKEVEHLRFVRWNKASEELMGLPRDAVLGKTDYDLFPPEEADISSTNDREVFAQGQIVEILGASIHTGHKGTRLLHTYKVPIYDAEGRPKYVLGISEDITERRQTEEALRASEARFRDLIEGSIQGIVIHRNLKPLFANQAYAEILGYDTPEDILRLDSLLPVLAPQERERITGYVRARQVGSEVPQHQEHQVIRKDGTPLWVDVKVREVLWHGERALQVTIYDITKRKQAEEALRRSQTQLQEQQRREKEQIGAELARVRDQLVTQTRLATLGQVASTIAHELRNPLGSVRNAVYYLRRHVAKGNAELTEFLQIIDVEVSTADRIINNLLEMSRAKQPLIQAVNLAQAVAEAFGHLKYPGQGDYCCRLDPDPFMVHADPAQLQQVLTNLLTNAVQAIAGKGEIIITGRRNGSQDMITIQDNGPGIPAEERTRIFEPLFSTKAKGTGLGLTICRQIVAKHGGTIDLVDSTHGAVFRIVLPRYDDGPEA
jgi:PAS domain S-box-containing protein